MLESNPMEAFTLQQKEARWFYLPVEPRFADLNHDGTMHVSKVLEFFEMSRFDVLRQFRSSVYSAVRDEELDQVFFLVVRADITPHKPWQGQRPLRVKTRLVVQKTPMLEFHQQLLDADSEEPYVSAVLKIAIVQKNMQRVENWEQEFVPGMSLFVVNQGRKEA